MLCTKSAQKTLRFGELNMQLSLFLLYPCSILLSHILRSLSYFNIKVILF